MKNIYLEKGINNLRLIYLMKKSQELSVYQFFMFLNKNTHRLIIKSREP